MLQLSCVYDKPCPKWHPPVKIRQMVNLDWPPFRPMMSQKPSLNVIILWLIDLSCDMLQGPGRY